MTHYQIFLGFPKSTFLLVQGEEFAVMIATLFCWLEIALVLTYCFHKVLIMSSKLFDCSKNTQLNFCSINQIYKKKNRYINLLVKHLISWYKSYIIFFFSVRKSFNLLIILTKTLKIPINLVHQKP